MPARPIFSWKNTGLFGICLIAIGTAYYFFDLVSDRFGSSLLDIFGMGAVIGVPVAFIGLIGWAKQLGKQARVQMAVAVFFAPWPLLFPGYMIDHLNFHGSAAPLIFLMLVAAILAVVLLIMAAAANRK